MLLRGDQSVMLAAVVVFSYIYAYICFTAPATRYTRRKIHTHPTRQSWDGTRVSPDDDMTTASPQKRSHSPNGAWAT